MLELNISDKIDVNEFIGYIVASRLDSISLRHIIKIAVISEIRVNYIIKYKL